MSDRMFTVLFAALAFATCGVFVYGFGVVLPQVMLEALAVYTGKEL
jgi:hypothetical protein